MNIDYSLTENAFKELGLEDFDEIYTQSAQDGLFDDFEKGFLSGEEFVERISKKFNVKPVHRDIEKAWNAMLLDFPGERLEMLRNLKNKYDLFLLSNTNEIHFNAFNRIFEGSYEIPFDSLFKKDFYSHMLHMRKPDLEVFQYILDSQKLEKTELLFIDDSEQHVLAASQIGLNAIFLKKGDDIIQVLSGIGILT